MTKMVSRPKEVCDLIRGYLAQCHICRHLNSMQDTITIQGRVICDTCVYRAGTFMLNARFRNT